MTVDVPVPPGVISVRAMDARTRQPVRGSVQLQVYRSDPGQRERRVHANTFRQNPERVVLGQGLFRIAATFGNSTESKSVEAKIGSDLQMDLWFEGQAAERSATIRVVMHRPSLLPNAFSPPRVELKGAGVARILYEGPNSLKLPPGNYEIIVAGNPPHRMPFTLTQDGSQFDATIEIVPGWFEAGTGQAGHFELFDQGGNPLAQFDGTKVAHSLPDGRYRLDYSDANGGMKTGQFDISVGRMQRVRLN